MFIASPKRDLGRYASTVEPSARVLFDYTVARTAFIALLGVLVVVAVWVYRSRERR